MNIQQQNTSEVPNTKTAMADNQDLDPPSPQDIYRMCLQRKACCIVHRLIQININMHVPRRK